MKQAILITAYVNLSHIQRIIRCFDDDFDFYIHIDKKSKEDYGYLKNQPNVFVYKKYPIYWGSDNHLFAIIYLIRRVLESNRNYDYCHLISGSDFPIKSAKQFKQFFSSANKNNYIEYFTLPHSNWGTTGGLERLQYYWLGHRHMDVRTSWLIPRILWLQRKLHIHRNLDFLPQLYGGGTYWSLRREVLQYAIEITDKQELLHHFAHSHTAEEIWMQSILLNAPQFIVVNDSLRYMHWIGNASSPSTLSNVDEMPAIRHSKSFFARKFIAGQSDELLRVIEEDIHAIV